MDNASGGSIFLHPSVLESTFVLALYSSKRRKSTAVTMIKNFAYSIAITGLLQLLPAVSQAESISGTRDSASFYYNLGREDQAGRRYATAWKYYEKAAKCNARDADVQLAIAEVCLKMNRMAPAIKALETATSLRPADYATQWKLTQLYFNYGQYNKVIEILPSLQKRLPEAKGAAFMLGKSYNSIQNYGKAIEYLKISLKEEPGNAEASYLIARMLVKMENYRAAIPYYYRTFSIDSTSQPSRLYEFALVLATAEQFDESIAFFQKAIERGYNAHDDLYMNMAYTMADAHKINEAFKIMKDMLQRRPQDLGLLSGLADICYHSGRYKEAIGYWDTMLGIDAKNARAVYQIGLAYIKMGKEKDGRHLCDEAISMDPSLGQLKHIKQVLF